MNERLIKAGRALSNAAYNLSQCAGKVLTERDAKSLDESRREWDDALTQHQVAVAPRRSLVGCHTCPHVVGDSYQRDCAYPDCAPATPPSPPAQSAKCLTCNGHGMLSNHASDGSWDDHPCPDCTLAQPSGQVLTVWSAFADREVLSIAPMNGNFSDDEVVAFCAGFRRCAATLAKIGAK